MVFKNEPSVRRLARWKAALMAASLAGCGAPASHTYDTLKAELRASRPNQQAAAQAEEVLLGRERLDRAALVSAVLARNPSVESARQAWRAALARYPQESSLDDPMLEYSIAPWSIVSSAPFGQSVRLSQRIPWPGKRALAGEVALAEAEATRQDYRATRLRLAVMASMLFDQYYAIARSLELNDEHHKLASDIKAVAEVHFESGHASQHEVLQADVELAHVEHRKVVFESRLQVVIAELNGLLHRDPHAELPPPPESIEPGALPAVDSAELEAEALRRRPELRARRARIEGQSAGVKLAKKAYYPDLGVMGTYSSMWRMREHQWMIGLALNLPIQLGRRRGAVDEAEARLSGERAELDRAVDEVRVEVERARQQLEQAHHVAMLYRTRLIPAARASIEAAQATYEVSRGGFQALIDAERSIRDLELEYQEAVADVGRKRAELERAVGRVPGLGDQGEAR